MPQRTSETVRELLEEAARADDLARALKDPLLRQSWQIVADCCRHLADLKLQSAGQMSCRSGPFH